MTVGRPEVLLYDPERFVDDNHLDARGAETFTTFVVAEVKEWLARGGNRTPRHRPSEK